MRVVWLRKQYQALQQYRSLAPLSNAAWKLQTYAINLKQYIRGVDDKALKALDEIEAIAKNISRAIKRGNIEEVKRLAKEAAEWRSIVAQAMAKVDDEGAQKSYFEMSGAIDDLGKN